MNITNDLFYLIIKELAKKTVVPVAAKIIWWEIKRKKNEDTLIFANVAAIGDLLYGMTFLEEIKTREPCKKIVVITFEKYKFIAESFHSYDELVLIPDRGIKWFAVKSLVANQGYAEKLFQDNIVIAPWGITTRVNVLDCNYIEALRRTFNLDIEVSIHYHNVLPAPVISISDFLSLYEKVVVLNPYSNSAELEREGFLFFEEACTFLKQKGYILYTNVIKDQRPISGSYELRCSLEEMLGIAYKIPLIVSLRSGILDFLAPTNINMFVLYNKPWHYSWFNIKAWRCKGIYDEVLYCEEAGEAIRLMDRFIKYMNNLN